MKTVWASPQDSGKESQDKEEMLLNPKPDNVIRNWARITNLDTAYT